MGSRDVGGQPDGFQGHKRRVFLLTSPRTASNLFVRMLNLDEQPDVVAANPMGGYFFMPPFMLRDKLEAWHMPFDDLTTDQKNMIGAEYQKSVDSLKDFVESSEGEGRIVFVKEHAHFMAKPAMQNDILNSPPAGSFKEPWMTRMEGFDVHSPSNPLFLPDDWLHTFMPVFLIRHPAVAFPSQLRAISDVTEKDKVLAPSRRALHELFFNYRVNRQLYDFYKSHSQKADPSSPWPLVIEAADLITTPEPVMDRFCDLTGIDRSNLKFRWNAATKEDLVQLRSDMNRRFLSTLSASTGILKDKASTDIDIDVEAVKWRGEFGEQVGQNMERWVRNSLPDYEYLLSRKWSPPVGDKNPTA